MAAGEGVARLDQQGVLEVGPRPVEQPLEQPVEDGAAGHRGEPVPKKSHRRLQARKAVATTTPKSTMASMDPKAVTTRKNVVKGGVARACR